MTIWKNYESTRTAALNLAPAKVRAYLLLLCVLLFNTHNIIAQKDTTKKFKGRMNQFDLGYSSATFFDGLGFKPPAFERGLTLLWGKLPIYYLSYKRFITNNSFVRVSCLAYSNEYNFQSSLTRTLKPGDITSRAFYQYELDVGKSVILSTKKTTKLLVDFGLSNYYRNGSGERIHLYYQNNYERKAVNSYYKSYGIGCFTGINFIFLNRLNLGTDFNYGYYFEKQRFVTQTNNFPDVEKSYKPNRHMMTNHLKLGVLF